VTSDRAIRVDEPIAQIIAGEGGFDGNLARFGHGLQRCYLLALLQELSGNDDSAGPRLILGCEEPELHQHPPQARHLADVLYRLSKRNSQVILSTHSPYFVSGERFGDVRMIRKQAGAERASVSSVTMEELAATIGHAKREQPIIPSATALKMQQALLPSLNELFFARVVVLVEGLEDVSYITAYFNLLDLWEEFRRQGCHLVAADNKSHMVHPLTITKHLGIPTFVVFDADGDKPDNKHGSRAKHEKDNLSILRIRGYDNQPAFPAETFWERDTVMWNSDIGTVVDGDLGPALLETVEKVRARFGFVGGLDKTAIFISNKMADSWEQGMRSPSLEKLCLSILEYASKST
jgi:putative ATP-dependent endonuclease of OLD family